VNVSFYLIDIDIAQHRFDGRCCVSFALPFLRQIEIEPRRMEREEMGREERVNKNTTPPSAVPSTTSLLTSDNRILHPEPDPLQQHYLP